MLHKPTILLVEDNPDDVLLVQRAFNKARVLNPLQIVRSGLEAVAYLAGREPYAERGRFPLPSLVLLDLIMPEMDGVELLRWIRRQPDLKDLHVVVTTSSKNLAEVNQAYALGADCCLVKPLDFDELSVFSQALGGEWLWLDEVAPDLAHNSPQRSPGGVLSTHWRSPT